MLKMLKFDFYKIFKSKMLLSFFIITLCLVFVSPLMFHIASESGDSVYASLYHQSSIFVGTSWIFIVPFVAKEFSSKYTKNFTANYSL